MKLTTQTTLTAVLLISIVLLLQSCNLTGKEVARIKVTEPSTTENLKIESADVELKAGDDISFWAQMDMRYKKPAKMEFEVHIIKDGENIEKLYLNPLETNITMNAKEVTINNNTKQSFTGKMSSYLITKDGNYTIKTAFFTSENIQLQLLQADLIIKK